MIKLPDHTFTPPPEKFGLLIEVGPSRTRMVCVGPGEARPWVSAHWKWHKTSDVAELGWKWIEVKP